MNAFDFWILRVATLPANRWPAFDAWVNLLSSWELVKGGAVMALFWWCWAEQGKNATRTRTLLVEMLLAAALALIAASLLAMALPYRPRPRIAIGMDPTLSPGWDQWSAFPSDHASLFFALAAGFFRLDRRLGWLALAHAVLVVSLPRVYLGLHYPTDILGGALLGFGATAVAKRWRRIGNIASRIVAWQVRRPRAAMATLFVVTYLVATLFTDLRRPAWLLRALTRGVSQGQHSQWQSAPSVGVAGRT